MKTLKCFMAAAIVGTVLGSGHPAQATLSDFSTSDGITYTGGGSSLSQVIPDNTAAGVAYSINFGTSGLNISDISVTLNLSGGYNGDIYAYLSHGSQSVVLLNQITGAANSSGFNITLVEGTGSSIQTAAGMAGQTLTGTYTANQNLVSFNNTDPNGSWTIFFADLNPGDTSTLNGFSISMTAVPEPITWALGIFGAGALLLTAGRWCWVRFKVAA